MKTLENIFWTLIFFAVIGNILFVVEFFYPLGDIMTNNFGEFGKLIGQFIGTITFLVDIVALSLFLSVKFKNKF